MNRFANYRNSPAREAGVTGSHPGHRRFWDRHDKQALPAAPRPRGRGSHGLCKQLEKLNSVSPVSPAAGYQGGKRNLARRICALIEATPHDGYAEPFVGMGGIFLRRAARPRVEVINDISGDVATFFRVLQEHYPYLIDMLRWRITGRAEFDRLAAMPADRLTDLQRAARFLYLQRLAFGGKVSPGWASAAHCSAGMVPKNSASPRMKSASAIRAAMSSSLRIAPALVAIVRPVRSAMHLRRVFVRVLITFWVSS